MSSKGWNAKDERMAWLCGQLSAELADAYRPDVKIILLALIENVAYHAGITTEDLLADIGKFYAVQDRGL